MKLLQECVQSALVTVTVRRRIVMYRTYSEYQETFQLNGLIGAQSGSKAMLAIMPKAYLGWYSELQKGTLTEYGARQTQGAYYTVDHDMIKRTQCRTGEILVDKLLTMFESPIEGAVIKYRQIVETLIEVFKQMERFGSADE